MRLGPVKGNGLDLVALALIAGCSPVPPVARSPAGTTEGNWPVPDDATNCTIVDMASPEGQVAMDFRGYTVELFGKSQCHLWGQQARYWRESGLSYEAIAKKMSGNEWLVRFINANTLLIVYYGVEETAEGERVWLVKLPP